jgi:flagellar assembly protein FliH
LVKAKRTFLSSNSENSGERGKPWVKFELGSFESLSLPRQTEETGFTSLQTGGVEGTDFIPLKETTDHYKKRKEAEDILREAREKADLLEREAYEKGFAQGEKDGLELGERKGLKQVETIERLLIEMNSLKQEIIGHYEKEILELVFAIAQKVVHQQVRSDDKAIEDTVLTAMKLAAEKSEMIVRVNPEDFDYVEKLRPEFLAAVKELKVLTVTSDPSITRGGCFLESPYGDVDGRVETQLEKIHQCLEGAFAERKR